jgi:hypothetical protein
MRVKKIIVNVPVNTIPYEQEKRYMICEYNGEIKNCIAFFKTWEEVLNYEHISECENMVNKLTVMAK